jgi:membrane protease YdiL (CAAX protease family)
MKNVINPIMNKLTNLIKHHQIPAFFIITFAITWGLGFSYGAVMNKGIFFLAPLVSIALCGPALAGIIISVVSNTQPRQGTRKAFWIAFFVAWVVSALVYIANNTLINHAPLSPVLIGFAFIMVVPVAFVISAAYSRIPAVKSYLTKLVRLRGVWTWAMLALVFVPALALLSFPLSSYIHKVPIAALRLPATGLSLVGLIVVKFLYQLFFNATGEETGWRGFALPRLQARASPLIACLVLAFFWAPWHLFLWQAEGKPVLTWQYWMDTYVNLIPATFFIVWFYNHSKGSILVAGIAHAAANTTFFFLTSLDWRLYNLILYIVVIGMVLVDRMWKKLPSDHPAVYQAPASLEPIEDPAFSATKSF